MIGKSSSTIVKIAMIFDDVCYPDRGGRNTFRIDLPISVQPADASLVLTETDFLNRLSFNSPLDLKFRADALASTLLLIMRFYSSCPICNRGSLRTRRNRAAQWDAKRAAQPIFLLR